MENWYLYNSELKLVSKEHKSADPIPDGLYHLSIEVWPFDGERFFLTKRASSKTFYPKYWECTGGSAIDDEMFEEAAIREIKEELGINVKQEDLIALGTQVNNKHIVRVFVLNVRQYTVFKCNNREIDFGRWYSVQELESLHLDENFVPHQFDRYLKYVRQYVNGIYLESKSKSLKRLIDFDHELSVPKRGLPSSGKRNDSFPFSPDLNIIYEAFQVYGDALYTQKTELQESVNNSLGTGNPLQLEPFPCIQKAINELFNSTTLSKYPFPAGDKECKSTILKYLHNEGFTKCLTVENIIFTESTTQAFNLALRLIVHPGDVVLFTSPTYGLFAFEPERLGGFSRFIELKEENDWLINPDELEKTIIEINNSLNNNFNGVNESCSRVVAFVNINPHNPTGKVMCKKHRNLLWNIADVCNRNGVFVIDDLIYRDLTFDRNNPAMPMASFDDQYKNVISMLGLSKAYSVAGLRAGMLVADEIIIRGIRNLLFQGIDSPSHLNAVALSACFSIEQERSLAYSSYFDKVLDLYQFNYNLMKAIIEGIESIDKSYYDRVYVFLKSNIIDDLDSWTKGIEGVKIVDKLEPESGFFCLVDFTYYKGKAYGVYIINDDISLLKYLFHRYRVNFITGKSISWPNPNEIIARFSFSLTPEKIIEIFKYIKIELSLLL